MMEHPVAMFLLVSYESQFSKEDNFAFLVYRTFSRGYGCKDVWDKFSVQQFSFPHQFIKLY